MLLTYLLYPDSDMSSAEHASLAAVAMLMRCTLRRLQEEETK